MQNKIIPSIEAPVTDTALASTGNANTESQEITSKLTQASASYHERLLLASLMEQLSHLCRAVQRHRGYSMGLLAGNKSFAGDFKELQIQMNRRIQLVSAFVNHRSVVLSKRDLESMHYAWNTISKNWQDDSVLENFEFHSHFVEQVLMMMTRLMERLQQPYSLELRSYLQPDSHKAEPTADEESIYQRLLAFSHHRLPSFIELLGKVRALSVHAAATGHCEPDYQKKLHYLLQCIAQQRDELFTSADYLQGLISDQLPTLLTIKTYEYKLNFLLDNIRSGILENVVITLKEEEVFGLVSDIMDIYWRVVDDSLRLLQDWQKDDLENWLLEG